MQPNEIIECIIKGIAHSSTNTIYVDVREVCNKEFVVLGLDISNFRLSINGSINKIIECEFDEVKGQYILTPKVKLIKSEWVVISLYDSVEVSALVRINNRIYKGCSSSIIIE